MKKPNTDWHYRLAFSWCQLGISVRHSTQSFVWLRTQQTLVEFLFCFFIFCNQPSASVTRVTRKFWAPHAHLKIYSCVWTFNDETQYDRECFVSACYTVFLSSFMRKITRNCIRTMVWPHAEQRHTAWETTRFWRADGKQYIARVKQLQ